MLRQQDGGEFVRRALDPIQFGEGPLVRHVPGVQGGGRFKEDRLYLLEGNRPVFHTSRNDDELTFLEKSPQPMGEGEGR